jgi:hypothetical protein
MRSRFWLTFGIAILCVAGHAQWTDPAADVPAFHANAPTRTAVEPPILHGQQLTGPNFEQAWQVKAYQDAAKIPNVLYQLPCYCHCDRAMGHTSLRSCFEGLHGAECDVCAREGIYAYQMTRKGWTAKQIRAGIERGDWKSIDLENNGKAKPHA